MVAHRVHLLQPVQVMALSTAAAPRAHTLLSFTVWTLRWASLRAHFLKSHSSHSSDGSPPTVFWPQRRAPPSYYQSFCGPFDAHKGTVRIWKVVRPHYQPAGRPVDIHPPAPPTQHCHRITQCGLVCH